MAISRDIGFGALTLRFTTDDHVPDGWYWLAQRTGPGDTRGTVIRGTDPKDDMVRPPVDWQRLDYTGGLMTFWRPVPPPGYRFFSDVLVPTSVDPRNDLLFGARAVRATRSRSGRSARSSKSIARWSPPP